MKRLLTILCLALVGPVLADPPAGRVQPAELCPVLKVNVTEYPTNWQLHLHPSEEGHRRIFLTSDYMNEQHGGPGIEVAVLWRNVDKHKLTDLTIRLEYQQATTGAIRSLEEHFTDVACGGHWTIFSLRGGEFEDTKHVSAWRISMLNGGKLVGQKQSCMWSPNQ